MKTAQFFLGLAIPLLLLLGCSSKTNFPETMNDMLITGELVIEGEDFSEWRKDHPCYDDEYLDGKCYEFFHRDYGLLLNYSRDCYWWDETIQENFKWTPYHWRINFSDETGMCSNERPVEDNGCLRWDDEVHR